MSKTWQRIKTLSHVIGGAAALTATAIAWRRLDQTAIALSDSGANVDRAHQGQDAPQITVVIPARDEAEHITRCVDSLLEQRLPISAIWVVDDGSIDATPLLVRALAAQDARVQMIAGGACPTGWVGKPWALQQGIDAALATQTPQPDHWLLLTDADTWHHPALLSRAYRYAIDHSLDLLSLAPRMDEPSVWAQLLRAAVGEWYTFYYGADYAMRADRPDQPAALALGQFILVRADRCRMAGGYSTAGVRDALDDDRAFVLRIKKMGGRTGFVQAPTLLRADGYRSLGEALRGHAHHLAPLLGAQRDLPLLSRTAVALDLATLWPFLGMGQAITAGARHGWRHQMIPLLRWGLQLVATALVRRRATKLADLPAWYPLAAPLGTVIMQGMLVSMLTQRLFFGRGGINWKGRQYD